MNTFWVPNTELNRARLEPWPGSDAPRNAQGAESGRSQGRDEEREGGSEGGRGRAVQCRINQTDRLKGRRGINEGDLHSPSNADSKKQSSLVIKCGNGEWEAQHRIHIWRSKSRLLNNTSLVQNGINPQASFWNFNRWQHFY